MLALELTYSRSMLFKENVRVRLVRQQMTLTINSSAIFICPTYYMLHAFPGRSFKVRLNTICSGRFLTDSDLFSRASSRSHRDCTETMSCTTSLELPPRPSTMRPSSMHSHSPSLLSSSTSIPILRSIQRRSHRSGTRTASKIRRCCLTKQLLGFR